MKYLRPLPLKTDYFAAIETEINRLLGALYYDRLRGLIAKYPKEMRNSADPLYDAVASGTIEFDEGLFKGKFNARISAQLIKLGAKFDSRLKAWRYPGGLPASLQMAKAAADARYKNLYDSVIKTLDNVDYGPVFEDSNIQTLYKRAINDMNFNFAKTVKNIAIAPELTEQTRNIISSQWGNNLELYIKDWAAQNIITLRERVQKSAFAGYRAQALVKSISEEYGVSKRKAQFLARQETSLLMSKFREERYKDVGANKYVWSGSMDEREREDHKLLEGQVFSWDSPPVVDRKTGRRAHPGEDFNCRCVPIAVMD